MKPSQSKSGNDKKTTSVDYRRLIIGILIAVFFGISLIYRIALPYDQVFGADWIKFTSIDAYYHIRLIDNLVQNFPDLTRFDPFFIFPGGSNVGGVHFFDWLVAATIWIIGLGSPTEHTVNVIGVYFPAIMAALTIIPVYFIGKALFNRWAGVLAAGLMAVFPGEYLGRSILGFTDHHVAEVLFTAIAMLFLVLAINEAGRRQLTFSNFMDGDRKALVRPLVYSLLAGFFLGIYLITWLGGMLFIFIITLYFIFQFIIDHFKRKSSDHLGFVGFVSLLVALIIFLPSSTARHLSIAMVVATIVPPVLSLISRFLSGKKLNPVYYPLTLVVIAAIFLGALFAAAPNILSLSWENLLGVFSPGGASASTTLEMQPFLSPQGSFSTLVAWGNFTTSFFLFKGFPFPGFGLISFVIMLYLFFKKRADDQPWLLFIIWTLVILIATLSQRRFAYYLVVNLALLSAYISWQIIWSFGLRKLTIRQVAVGKKVRQESRGLNIYHVNTALAIIIVFLLVFYWNIGKSAEVAKEPRFAPTDAWQESLYWLEENTPEPLGDPGAYDLLYEPGYKYPESAYGVTSWWDYGYWISRTAHRIPSANPSQAPIPITRVANLFLSQDESEIQEKIAELGSSYIVADYAMSTSKFWAIVTWAGHDQDEFVGFYAVPRDGELTPVQLYHPEYYRSTLVRLYNFDGKAVTDVAPMVVTWEPRVDNAGTPYRLITNAEEFTSYDDALAYIQSKEQGNYTIASSNPFISPIPLEAMEDYKLVFSSKSGVSQANVGLVPEVKVFEYVK